MSCNCAVLIISEARLLFLRLLARPVSCDLLVVSVSSSSLGGSVFFSLPLTLSVRAVTPLPLHSHGVIEAEGFHVVSFLNLVFMVGILNDKESLLSCLL